MLAIVPAEGDLVGGSGSGGGGGGGGGGAPRRFLSVTPEYSRTVVELLLLLLPFHIGMLVGCQRHYRTVKDIEIGGLVKF